ncbi:helix-turn-helix domain-containing protein [Mesobacillus subterraneus]|uniref:XRE family transcriptional regulator n=1 Tax=Mesobacillus subterraneus TaxID=285983 RepID=A0A3R9E5R8_9BACI|nr:helix-turn-helix transcriptional regulator [Mesobacillus subterraneus]RSD21053.1 XRE family transcriptional regulator [Mesobacillus subterraneus]
MLSKRLRMARKAKDYTQEKLASLVSTKKTTISNYETGYSSPSNEMLNDLADVLEVSTDYLLGRTDEPTKVIVQKEVEKQDEEDELEKLLNDPDVELWAKEWSESTEENRKIALDLLRKLNEVEKGRKPGDRQK